jgi:WhiB family transcriptional regulator, redox-sensing transcriptional regulator
VQGIRRIDLPPRDGDCKGQDPRIWYPHADRSEPGKFAEKYRIAAAQTASAKNICNSCPVQLDCLSYAMYHEPYGIWGGLTEREREQLRRKLKISIIPRDPVNTLPGMSLR